jgi:hypothetical protein
MDSLIRGNSQAVKLAVKCSLVIGGTLIAASSFRAVLNYVFSEEPNRFGLSQIIIVSLTASVLWFLLTTVCALRGTTPMSTDSAAPSTKGERIQSLAVSFAVSVAIAMALAISAWLALETNDRLFYSRLLPWIPSLIWFQEAGFQTAARLFPCRYEGFDVGCEAYKRLPVFVLSNAIAYFPFSLATVFLILYTESSRSFLKAVRAAFLRWGGLVGVVLLCLRLVFYRLSPDVSGPNTPSRLGHMAWVLLQSIAGLITVALILAIPFVLYGAILGVWNRERISERLLDLTRVSAFLLAALILGNQ